VGRKKKVNKTHAPTSFLLSALRAVCLPRLLMHGAIKARCARTASGPEEQKKKSHSLPLAGAHVKTRAKDAHSVPIEEECDAVTAVTQPTVRSEKKETNKASR
jgi:hypothetical protein